MQVHQGSERDSTKYESSTPARLDTRVLASRLSTFPESKPNGDCCEVQKKNQRTIQNQTEVQSKAQRDSHQLNHPPTACKDW